MKRIFLFASILLTLAGLSSSAFAEKAIPTSPRTYVLDEPNVLTASEKRTLEVLLTEQDRLSGDQIVVGIFDSLDGADLLDYTNRVFKAWKIGTRERNSGALIAIFWKDHQVRIEVGYGLEPVLTDAKSKGIIEDFIIPGIKNQKPGEGLIRGTIEILNLLESTLVQTGQLEEILNQGKLGALAKPAATPFPVYSLIKLILLILIFFVLPLLDRVRGRHFSSGGWYRTGPRIRLGGFGGMGGGGFGGGGFMGGGGRSGGGGASGSW